VVRGPPKLFLYARRERAGDEVVGATKGLGQLRLALDADFQRRALQRAQREHLADDLKNGMLSREREVLDCSGVLETPGTQSGSVHRLIVARAGSAADAT
jgi:hypothetical protein